jgi:hypothetical protein
MKTCTKCGDELVLGLVDYLPCPCEDAPAVVAKFQFGPVPTKPIRLPKIEPPKTAAGKLDLVSALMRSYFPRERFEGEETELRSGSAMAMVDRWKRERAPEPDPRTTWRRWGDTEQESGWYWTCDTPSGNTAAMHFSEFATYPPDMRVMGPVEAPEPPEGAE